jgi:hypothetical protein
LYAEARLHPPHPRCALWSDSPLNLLQTHKIPVISLEKLKFGVLYKHQRNKKNQVHIKLGNITQIKLNLSHYVSNITCTVYPCSLWIFMRWKVTAFTSSLISWMVGSNSSPNASASKKNLSGPSFLIFT